MINHFRLSNMRGPARPGFRFLPALAPALMLALMLSACSGLDLPKTTPLSPKEQREAAAGLRALVGETRSSSVETGYDLSWEFMGQRGKFAAQLQMDAPDLLRLDLFDALGRTLYLAVADGERFRLIDNRAAKVRVGRLDGPAWRRFVPEPLDMREVAALLGGRPSHVPLLLTATGNADATGYWFEWQENGQGRRLLLDRETGLAARYVMLDKQKDILLDIRYLNYDQDRASGYFWPGKVEISGALVKGRFLLERDGPLSFDPLPLAVFHPEIPPHFTEEWVR